MSRLPGDSNQFSQDRFIQRPLLANLAKIQACGHQTLEKYLEYVFAETQSQLVLPVLDESIRPLILVIKSTDKKGTISGFWNHPFCSKHCDSETWSHPCHNTASGAADCDMFCAGFSVDDDEENTGALNLDQQSLHTMCTVDRKGELVSCGILAIILHYQNRQDQRRVLVSVELTIGCNKRQQGAFVIQRHDGLKISLQ